MTRAAPFAIAAVLAGCAAQQGPPPPPLFSGIPGASVGGSAVRPKPAEGLLRLPPVRRLEETEDGEIILRSGTVGDLMANIIYTLDEDRPDLFVDFLLSELTSQEFARRGLDPAAAFDEIKRRERDARKLFTRLPGGEFTPGVFMTPQGRGVFRLAVRGGEDFPWRGLDVRFEGRSWRLRWFVE